MSTHDAAGGVYDDLELPCGTWRPYTAVQMVMTVDGAIKGPTDDYWPISLDADQRTFRRFRTKFDAVLHGAHTLGMRIDRYMWSAEQRRERRRRDLHEPPLFIVVSNSGTIDPSDRVFQRRTYPIAPLVVVPESAEITAGLAEVAEIVRVGTDSVDLIGLMRYLVDERGVRRLVCEGGAILNYHMLTGGLVDEFFITVTPSIIGEPRPRTAVEGSAALPSDQLQRLELLSTISRGGEVFLRYRVRGASPLA
ncbi:MAG: RibD family protein [Chloroflexota bacterium]|nr:RibD family protein [Chloroflexota bacterium]